MWEKVIAIEPISKNPSALVPAEAPLAEGFHATNFVPVHQLTESLEV
jgi:hypothetical protein